VQTYVRDAWAWRRAGRAAEEPSELGPVPTLATPRAIPPASGLHPASRSLTSPGILHYHRRCRRARSGLDPCRYLEMHIKYIRTYIPTGLEIFLHATDIN
jgi:hypothetical protein